MPAWNFIIANNSDGWTRLENRDIRSRAGGRAGEGVKSTIAIYSAGGVVSFTRPDGICSGIIPFPGNTEITVIMLQTNLGRPKQGKVLSSFRLRETIAAELNLENIFGKPREGVAARSVGAIRLVGGGTGANKNGDSDHPTKT